MVKHTYLYNKICNIIGDLLYQQLNDVQYLRGGSDQDDVLQVCVWMLGVLSQGIVAGYLLGHGDDEGRWSSSGDERQGMAGRPAGIRSRRQWKTIRCAGRIITKETL